VEEQSEKYVKGIPFGLPAWRSPLPFLLRIHRHRDPFHQPARSRAAEPKRLCVSPSRNFIAWHENHAPPQAIESIGDYANRKGNFLSRMQHMPLRRPDVVDQRPVSSSR
jgi:hypothetical protein